MKDPHERYLESALEELYQGGPDADLRERILQRDTEAPQLSVVHDTLPRKRNWLWLQAACAVLALGVIALLLVPRDDEKLPETVAASGETGYRVHDEEIELESGWYVLETGAPVATAGDSRIEQVNGRALVKVGEIPDETELQAHQEWLRQNGVENEMLSGNWIKVGGMAVCILIGSAVVDGQPLHAQKSESVKDADRKNDDSKDDNADTSEHGKLARITKKLNSVLKEIKDAEVELLRARDSGVEEDIAEKELALKKLQDARAELLSHEITEWETLVETARKEVTAAEQDPSENPKRLAELKHSLKILEETLRQKKEGKGDDARDEGALISLDFVKKDIHTVMHFIAQQSGLQIIVEGEISVELTVMFKDVTPKDAIRSICKANKLNMVEDGEIIIIRAGDGGSTAERDVDPDKPISVTYDDKPISLALIDIQKRSGLDIVYDAGPDYDSTVSIALKDLPPRTVVVLICETADLRVVDLVETIYVRKPLEDLNDAELKDELEDLATGSEALEQRIQFMIVAIEAAEDSGDKEFAADLKKKLAVKQKTQEAHKAEITKLKEGLGEK
ncbi:MAG: hypothetical protein KDB68_10865 [Planctomycetes bacterium]|nr:hypothetical protein [Planctomycetota bacterium]